MLKTVPIKNLKPNPFRRLDEYPILREKVDALKESIASTGFWGTIVGRPAEPHTIEIAFGHHRLVALQEGAGGGDTVEIIVRDLSNEDMVRMMARENMEEWGTSAWVELETVRATIDAYGKGLIELPKAPGKTPKNQMRYVCQGIGTHPYTQAMVAEFLGWTRKAHENGLRPNYACEVAFEALDMIDKGLLREADLKGLTRGQTGNMIDSLRSIHVAEMKEAERNRKEAEQAKELAAKTTAATERKRLEKQAAVHEEQAKQHQADAKSKAKDFGKEAADRLRGGAGVIDIRKRAEELKPGGEQPTKIHNVDELADKIARKLEHIANGDDDLSGDVRFLKQVKNDLSDRAAKGLCQSFASLIDRLARMQGAFEVSTSTSRSHADGTGVDHERKAISHSQRED